jgi:hypothetical protein
MVLSASRIAPSTRSTLTPRLCAFRAIAAGALTIAIVVSGGVLPSMAQPTARAARSMSVSESAHLRLTSRQGTRVFNEKGNMAGTIPGSLVMQMNIAHYGRAAITFTLYAKDGTLAGKGEASFYAAGNTAYFTGSLSLTHGTHKYAHAAARGLKIQGSFQRNNFAVYVTVKGTLST